MRTAIVGTLVLLIGTGCIRKTATIVPDPDLAGADTSGDGTAGTDAATDMGTAADMITDAGTATDAAADTATDAAAEVEPEAGTDGPGPDTQDPCLEETCGNGSCTPGCGEEADTCPADCCDCGDLACDILCGEWTASCAVDCCQCGDGKCSISPCGETALSCTDDCWMFVCGNGVCDPGETPLPDGCPWDCGNAACGNGECEPGEGPQTCPFDCTPFACGNHVCEEGENPALCPIDCSEKCGDCACDPEESWLSCPEDCGYCGDGQCSVKCAAESVTTCAQDCCDDGNPCTADQIQVDGGGVQCSFEPLSGTTCDGPCDEGETAGCQDGVCVCA
ncbi:MAG: hypothetical protein FJ098_06815 [Deltaproteobacteria bacterium]|nr:hypothetical protein [Deltaproteobacteria bacterium]